MLLLLPPLFFSSHYCHLNSFNPGFSSNSNPGNNNGNNNNNNQNRRFNENNNNNGFSSGGGGGGGGGGGLPTAVSTTVVVNSGRKLLQTVVAPSPAAMGPAPAAAAGCLTVEEVRSSELPAFACKKNDRHSFAEAADWIIRRLISCGSPRRTNDVSPRSKLRFLDGGRRRGRRAAAGSRLPQVFGALPQLYFLRNAVVNQRLRDALDSREGSPLTVFAPSDSAVRRVSSPPPPPLRMPFPSSPLLPNCLANDEPLPLAVNRTEE